MSKRRKRNRKWISWLIILILLIGAGTVCYLVWDSYFRKEDNTVQNESIKEEEKKESSEAEAELKSETPEKKKVEQYDGEDPNQANELTGVVTYAGVSGSNLIIRVNIDQYLESGQCELTLKRGGANIYSSIASIIGNASTATCEGFDVPISKLGGGNIEININLKANNKAGLIRGEANI